MTSKSRTIRRLMVVLAAATGVVLLGLASAFYALQTTWFKNKVREEIVSEIEKSTGGTVELGAFDYRASTLTAEFRNLVVHGTEAADTEPLFRADSIRVGLRVISAFRQKFDISSLIVNQPHVHLVVAADGSTNIPSPRLSSEVSEEGVADLLRLKIRHFEVNQGVLEADVRTIPLNIRGNDISLLLTYRRRGRLYSAKFSSHALRVNAEQWPSINGGVEIAAELGRDRVVIQRVAIVAGNSTLEASGMVQHFAQPSADFKLTTQLAARDLANFSRFSDLRDGKFTFEGAAHYDESTRFRFSGTIAGRGVAYRSGTFALNNADLDSRVRADQQGAEFTRLSLNAAEGHLAGQAMLSRYRDLQFGGVVSGLTVAEVTRWVSKRASPYAGLVSGPVHGELSVATHSPNLVLRGKLKIAPASRGAPVSGDVEATYKGTDGVVVFGPSHLDAPNTHVSFAGTVGATLQIMLDSKNLDDLKPALSILSSRPSALVLPTLKQNGSAHFQGTILGSLQSPQLAGDVTLTHFLMRHQEWDQVRSKIVLSSKELAFSSAVIDRGRMHATASGHIAGENWVPTAQSSLRLEAQFRGADIGKLSAAYPTMNLPLLGGIASGAIDIGGSLLDPQGKVQLTINNADAYGERLNMVQIAAALGDRQVRITRGRIQAGPALMSFSGTYRHNPQSWRDGDLQLRIDSNGFPLASLAPIRRYQPGLNADFEIHGQGAIHIAAGRIEPRNADGTAILRRITVHNVPYGSITFNAATTGQALHTRFSGDLRGSALSGHAQVLLVVGNPANGEVRLDRIALSTLSTIMNPTETRPLPVEGFIRGVLSFEGPLQQPVKMRGAVRIEEVQVSTSVPGQTAVPEQAANLIFRNMRPIVLEAADGVATIRSFELGGTDTNLILSGSFPYLRGRPINMDVNGSLQLQFVQLFTPNVRSSGDSHVAASVRGTPVNPVVNGTVQLHNGSFLFRNSANALTNVNGTIRFDRNRATIQKLTAETGGGRLSLAGFMSLPTTGQPVYQLEANAENVRFRYAGDISATAGAQLRLSGTSENSTLSGRITVGRIVLNQNADLGALLASTAAPGPSPTENAAFLTGMRFDVRLESVPNLEVSTAMSRDLEADIDLRLRGTRAHPVLLGNITANQGEIRIFGSKYRISRGEVSFVNPARIDPVLALDLQTQARGVRVDITISGTLGKLNVNYRSDPPLQPRDIIALLAVGRAPTVSEGIANTPAVSDVSALQSAGSSFIGQALSPSSGRLSKLFGVTNIRIDPTIPLITNAAQARLTVEQNISRDVTVTYVTNVSQTAEQIFRLEWDFSPQYSVVALRDDNGEFGIDIQYRKRFK